MVRVRHMHRMISRRYDETRTTFHHATCRRRHCHHLCHRRYLSSPSPSSSSSLTGPNRPHHYHLRRYLRNCHYLSSPSLFCVVATSPSLFLRSRHLCVVATYGHRLPFVTFTILRSRLMRRRHLRAQTALCHLHYLRRRHLRAQTAPLGTTCVLVRGDSNLQPSGWSVPPLPLHQHITGGSASAFRSLLDCFLQSACLDI